MQDISDRRKYLVAAMIVPSQHLALSLAPIATPA